MAAVVLAAAAANAWVGWWLLRPWHAQPAVMREQCIKKLKRAETRIERVICDRGAGQPSGFQIPCRNKARNNLARKELYKNHRVLKGPAADSIWLGRGRFKTLQEGLSSVGS